MSTVVSDLILSQAPVDSPFVPGTNIQYAWDSVSLTTILACPRRYKLGIIEGWQPRNPNIAVALAFGISVHSGNELFWKYRMKGSSYNDAVTDALHDLTKTEHYQQLPVEADIEEMKDGQEEDDDGIDLRNSKIRTRYHLMRALVWYFEQYRQEAMPVLRLADGTPAVEYSFRVPVGKKLSDGTELLLSGHIDKVVEFNDELFIADLKTTKSITRQYRQGFDLSHQMTGYTLGGNLVLPRPVKGVFIDALALQVGGVLFSRFQTRRTDAQMKEYIDLLGYVGEMAEYYAANDYYPLNTSACIFCEFKPVCRVDPRMRQGHLNGEFVRRPPWNPLANR